VVVVVVVALSSYRRRPLSLLMQGAAAEPAVPGDAEEGPPTSSCSQVGVLEVAGSALIAARAHNPCLSVMWHQLSSWGCLPGMYPPAHVSWHPFSVSHRRQFGRLWMGVTHA
jgi:hypothetical protein